MGSVLSSMELENRICPCWRHWDDSVGVRMARTSSRSYGSMRQVGCCTCQRISRQANVRCFSVRINLLSAPLWLPVASRNVL